MSAIDHPDVQEPEIDSDYTAAEMEQDGVDDEASLNASAPVRFSISSYGADYTVDSLIRRMESGAFFVPEFQRSYVWTQKQASRFIESLLLGLPIPSVFVAKERDSSRHLIIDGQQRLKTLQYFFEGVFKEKKFRLIDVAEPWTNKTIDEISPDDRLKLEDSVIHTIVFKQEFT
ncbi:MAG: DUF262 domain-containing protein [Thalassobaculum sp.]